MNTYDGDKPNNVTIRLFSQRSHYRPGDRGMLADILRPYWKDSPISAEERIAAYGVQTERFQLVDEPANADFCVLPMYWNFYYAQHRIRDAQNFVQTALSHGKPVISWVGGDFGVRVPSDAVYVFRASGYRSRRGSRQFASPVFIRDPAKEMPNNDLVFRSKPERPRIGFCGQAGDSFWKRTSKVMMTAARNSSFYLRFSPHEPQSLYPPTLLRARALQILERCPHVDTIFVKREKYRAGADPDDVVSRQTTRREFLENIWETDYAVCIRGTGNFSQRFYEVMAMGRIPVFVNTDCMLPFDHIVDWRQYCVWVEA